MVNYTLKVVDIRIETEDALTLCFKQPGLRKVRYQAGQYLTLMFRINGRRYVRPYSFSSAPSLDTLIEVTVKRVPNGIVSNHIHDQVKIGDVIEVMEPMGDFIYDAEHSAKDIYFWGIGSGITPLISLIREILASNTGVNIYLIYGNRNFDTTIFHKIIESLLAKYPQRFKAWHFHTRYVLNENNPCVIEGRIQNEQALAILKNFDLSYSLHYICGPNGLKESVRDVLKDLNVSFENVYSEDFELIKDPKDFEDIHTQVISLKFQGTISTLEIIKGKSILESALDAGIELPYSCQTGNCSTCKAVCLNGKVKMIGLSKKRTDLRADEYLLCCCHPLTEGVYLEI